MSEEKISLSKLSSLCGSDKHAHGFTDFYQKYLGELDPKVICEIGMGGRIPPGFFGYGQIEEDNPGGSSRMWLRYFPNSKVYIMDNFSQVSEEEVNTVITEVVNTNDGRYNLVQGDQADREDLKNYMKNVGSEVDFLVDDGGHKMDQQQISLGFLFPHIKAGGFYIIEDIHTSEFNPGPKWGLYDDRSNSTLKMLENFQHTGKFASYYMSQEQTDYLNEHVTFCEVWRSSDGKSMTSILGKK